MHASCTRTSPISPVRHVPVIDIIIRVKITIGFFDEIIQVIRGFVLNPVLSVVFRNFLLIV
jgi:hypothetical protein